MFVVSLFTFFQVNTPISTPNFKNDVSIKSQIFNIFISKSVLSRFVLLEHKYTPPPLIFDFLFFLILAPTGGL